mmetsp:Transcript_48797/g.145793  ORF Transcript_48797/g.145793 Transcript_48797/m.145793 type:complete len:189 (+) Transcript_48797:682-1248(+)
MDVSARSLALKSSVLALVSGGGMKLLGSDAAVPQSMHWSRFSEQGGHKAKSRWFVWICVWHAVHSRHRGSVFGRLSGLLCAVQYLGLPGETAGGDGGGTGGGTAAGAGDCTAGATNEPAPASAAKSKAPESLGAAGLIDGSSGLAATCLWCTGLKQLCTSSVLAEQPAPQTMQRSCLSEHGGHREWSV